MSSLKWKYASADDLIAFYGRQPCWPMNAAVATLFGEVVGVIGVARRQDHGLFFSEWKPELDPYLSRMPVLRAIKAMMKIVETYPVPVYSATEIEKGHKILRRLGFTEIEEGLYQWI